MAATIRLSRTREDAATLALASASVAPVAYGYERSLRSCASDVSRLARTTQPEGGR
jgi:hypothetical protein